MKKLLVTGAAGLVGSATVERFADDNFKVYGIDNDSRQVYFGTSTKEVEQGLDRKYGNFFPLNVDVRDRHALIDIFRQYGPFDCIVHAAAQPAHDYSIRNTTMDFEVNAVGTFNMLQTFREFSPEAVFVQVSTSKVYGDHVNHLPLIETETRYDLDVLHKWYEGIDETMSVEGCLHSPFGASKLAGDIMSQEYGRYFNLAVAVFRPVCITGPAHQGAPLHGYLAYLVKQMAAREEYVVNGYKGKQVRDNIHARDLASAFYQVYRSPEDIYGEVYNIGAGRESNNSILEAVAFCEERFGKNPNLKYSDVARRGDHKWCIFDSSKFMSRFPAWRITYNNQRLMTELCDACADRISRDFVGGDIPSPAYLQTVVPTQTRAI